MRIASDRELAKSAALRHSGPAAQLDKLNTAGRIYLVQLGPHRSPYSLDSLAQWLRTKYALDVQLLPASGLDSAAWTAGRRQYAAELLYAQIKREHPALAIDPNAWLIGFTDVAMYPVHESWSRTFTQRDLERAAIISTDGMQDQWWQLGRGGLAAAHEHFQSRLQRILLKDVALLYWNLPLNNDPTSLLHHTLDPDIPAQDIYQSDLDPARTPTGEFTGEPCLFFTWSAKDGLAPLPGDLIRTCSDKDIPDTDESIELLQVDLRLGLLIDKHTDFMLPGAVPLKFQRALRDGWSGENPFGLSGTDDYDEFLAQPDTTHTSIVHNDGGREELALSSHWWPKAQDVKFIDTDYSGRYYEMRRQAAPSDHYELKRYDGVTETFMPCSGPIQLCFLNGYKDPQGRSLTFERDAYRRLTLLTSPDRAWLHFSYGQGIRIAQIDDSRGRTVSYDYDAHNRLTSVTYPSGQIIRYQYDVSQHMLAFSVAANANAPPQTILRNEYVDGKITRQSFANGATYLYKYSPEAEDPAGKIWVSISDGREIAIQLTADGCIFRESGSAHASSRSPSRP